MVLRRCRRLLRNEEEALDACQDVFVRVIERRVRLDARYPSSLLYRIATNVCLNRLRDSRREPLTRDEAILAEIARAEEPAGVHWNPFTAAHPSSRIKPYVAVTVGPLFGAAAGNSVTPNTVSSGTSTQSTAGGHVGGGVDFHVGRPFAFGVSGGYNWMVDFSRPIGPRDNYSGAELGVSFGFLFGKGR